MTALTVRYATTANKMVTSLEWALKEYGITVEPFIMTFPEREDDPRRSATKRVMKAYPEVCKSFSRPEHCIAVAATIYLQNEQGAFSIIGGRKVEDVLAATDQKEVPCEIRHALAHIDPTRGALFPDLYTSTLEVTIAPVPRGEMRDYHTSPLVTIIKPKNMSGRTLAELPFLEYKEWHRQNARYAHLFGERIARLGNLPH